MSNPKDTYVGLVYHTKQLLMLSRKRCKREALQDCRVPINGVILCECFIGRNLDVAVSCVAWHLFQTQSGKRFILFIRGSGHNSCILYLFCMQAGLMHISPSSVAAYSEQPGQIQQLQEECDYSLLFQVRT